MTFNPLIPRRAQVIVTVTRPNSTGTPVQQTYTFQDHRMRIMVRQSGQQFGNAKVEVFGVPLASMNQIARLWGEALTPQGTDTLTINVWNGMSFVPFFQGVIAWSAVDASGMPNVKLSIEANSAFGLMITPASPYANAGPVLLKDVLTTLGTLGGFTIDYSTSAPNYSLTDVRLVGTPMEQLAAVMNYFPDLTWTTVLQRVKVRQKDAPYSSEAINIAPETGLVGYPVYSTSGLQFDTLFNPLIYPGAALNIKTQFDFVTRTTWIAAVLAHELDVNVPGGKWMTSVAAQNFGPAGNNQT